MYADYNMTKNGKTKDKYVDLDYLEGRFNRLSDNELKHLDEKIQKVDGKVDDLGERFEVRFDAIEKKIARWGGGLAAIVFLLDLLLRIFFHQ